MPNKSCIKNLVSPRGKSVAISSNKKFKKITDKKLVKKNLTNDIKISFFSNKFIIFEIIKNVVYKESKSNTQSSGFFNDQV